MAYPSTPDGFLPRMPVLKTAVQPPAQPPPTPEIAPGQPRMPGFPPPIPNLPGAPTLPPQPPPTPEINPGQPRMPGFPPAIPNLPDSPPARRVLPYSWGNFGAKTQFNTLNDALGAILQNHPEFASGQGRVNLMDPNRFPELFENGNYIGPNPSSNYQQDATFNEDPLFAQRMARAGRDPAETYAALTTAGKPLNYTGELNGAYYVNGHVIPGGEANDFNNRFVFDFSQIGQSGGAGPQFQGNTGGGAGGGGGIVAPRYMDTGGSMLPSGNPALGLANLGGNPAARGAGGVGVPPGSGGGIADNFTGTPTTMGGSIGDGGIGWGGPGGIGNMGDANLGFDGLSPVAADMSGLPDINTDFSGAARDARRAVYDQAISLMQPDIDRERTSLIQRLNNQGIPIGSEAYNQELDRFDRQTNLSRERAARDAVLAGNTEAGNLFGRSVTARSALGGERERTADRRFSQGLGIANLGLGRRAQDLQRYGIDTGAATSRYGVNAGLSQSGLNANLRLRELGLTEDNQNFQQLMQLLAGARGGVNLPNFGAPGSIDVLGANQLVNGMDQFNTNRTDQRNAARNSGLFNLGALLLGGMFR